MKFEITDTSEKTCTYKRTSKIKRFFDKLLDKFLKQLKEELKDKVEVKDDKQLIELINEFTAQNRKIVIALDKEETTEFRKISRRDYLSNTDTCTLLENGKWTTSMNGPKQFIKALLDKGIKPPIKASIGTNREGKITVTFTRTL